jgi:hypothetical protein
MVIDDPIASHKTFHLTSLEGAAFGQAVLTSVPTAAGYPFHETTLATLEAQLRLACSRRDLVQEWGCEARSWIETHWNPVRQVEEYLAAYTGKKEVHEPRQTRRDVQSDCPTVHGSFASRVLRH